MNQEPVTVLGNELVAPQLPARGTSWTRRLVIGLVLLGATAFFAEVVRVVVGRNYHAILSGQAYRSAQLSPSQLKSAVEQDGIRTIVNLRGRCPGFEWFDDEGQSSQDLNLNHESLTFSATRLPSKVEVRRLIGIFDQAERPLLLHCRRGADRTGMAALVFLLSQTDIPYDEARSSLGLRYGHWRWGAAGTLDTFFAEYERHLSSRGLTHSRDRFRTWVLEHYEGEIASYRVVRCVPMSAEPRVGQIIAFKMTFRNLSSRTWQFQPIRRAGVHLGAQLMDCRTGASLGNSSGYLERSVSPGEEIELVAAFPPVSSPGRYRFRADLYEEGNAWFHQLGGTPHEEEIIVRE